MCFLGDDAALLPYHPRIFHFTHGLFHMTHDPDAVYPLGVAGMSRD